MKAITKSLLALLFVAAVGLVNLNAKSISLATVSDQIAELMQNVVLPDGEVYEADVKFYINEKSEIVVLSVDTESDSFESLVKLRLNYHKVEPVDMKLNQIARIKLKIKQPS